MVIYQSGVTVLQTLVVALGCRYWLCGVWSTSWRGTAMTIPVPSPRASKQLMAGGGVVLIGTTLIPLLSGLF